MSFHRSFPSIHSWSTAMQFAATPDNFCRNHNRFSGLSRAIEGRPTLHWRIVNVKLNKSHRFYCVMISFLGRHSPWLWYLFVRIYLWNPSLKLVYSVHICSERSHRITYISAIMIAITDTIKTSWWYYFRFVRMW